MARSIPRSFGMMAWGSDIICCVLFLLLVWLRDLKPNVSRETNMYNPKWKGKWRTNMYNVCLLSYFVSQGSVQRLLMMQGRIDPCMSVLMFMHAGRNWNKHDRCMQEQEHAAWQMHAGTGTSRMTDACRNGTAAAWQMHAGTGTPHDRCMQQLEQAAWQMHAGTGTSRGRFRNYGTIEL
jgi:hypothetical protein